MCVTTKLTEVDFAKQCEDLGFDWLWVPDSQMIWGDCYAYLALAAERTSRIKLATGVAVAGTRAAPVIAHSIASIATTARCFTTTVWPTSKPATASATG